MPKRYRPTPPEFGVGLPFGVASGVGVDLTPFVVVRAPLMEPLIEQLREATGAQFELIVAENSLFGPTITTAGLLVGRDIMSALNGRHDLDIALIPAETINEDSVFLDDFTLEAVRAEVPMPIFPSYDFIDVLASEAAGVAA